MKSLVSPTFAAISPHLSRSTVSLPHSSFSSSKSSILALQNLNFCTLGPKSCLDKPAVCCLHQSSQMGPPRSSSSSEIHLSRLSSSLSNILNCDLSLKRTHFASATLKSINSPGISENGSEGSLSVSSIRSLLSRFISTKHETSLRSSKIPKSGAENTPPLDPNIWDSDAFVPSPKLGKPSEIGLSEVQEAPSNHQPSTKLGKLSEIARAVLSAFAQFCP